MCSLCGVLYGRAHWTESSGSPEAFQSRHEPHTRIRERQERVRVVNQVLKHYGLRLSDWQGNSYMLHQSTGRTELVENLSELWTAAEGLIKRPLDPLNADLLASLRQT